MISIHAPLTGSDITQKAVRSRIKISIHAPLTGSDLVESIPRIITRISIHAPLTGSDNLPKFMDASGKDFNPRSPYGERPKPRDAQTPGPGFQSTLPLRGATQRHSIGQIADQFQSTLPLRGATRVVRHGRIPPLFQSTLPLRGATCSRPPGSRFCLDFNPRSPYGERLIQSIKKNDRQNFNPRSPYGERLCLIRMRDL